MKAMVECSMFDADENGDAQERIREIVAFIEKN